MTVYRQTKLIFKDLSFQVKTGEWLGITGSNGVGKSTLVKALLGLEDYQAGEILFLGQNKDHFKPCQWYKELQLVTQYTRNALDPTKTIERLLREPLSFFFPEEKAIQRQQIQQVLEQCSLTSDILKKKPRQLSGGQYQRVCIALALLARPKLLICDEATASLDKITELKIIQLLKNNMNLTVIFISHQHQLVQSVCDRCVQLSQFGFKSERVCPTRQLKQ